MPKLIFLDIDGTLLLPGHPMSQRVAQALRRAKQNGHKLFLCTGRSRVMLPAELTAFGFDGIVCSAGGYVTLGVPQSGMPGDHLRRPAGPRRTGRPRRQQRAGPDAGGAFRPV